jgi:regulator of protease activity HflC (stomatin/prohibitin superfamily)
MKNAVKTLMACFAAAFIAGCGQVDTGEVGFFTRWGEVVSKKPLDEGLHFYEPFGTDLITYNVKNQTLKLNTEVFTKDVQSMTVSLMVTFNLEKDKVISLHSETGKKYADILIMPSVLGAAKDALGKMEAGDIVANREVATKAIFEAISSKLTPYGINIVLVNIANIDYSDAFEKAVEEKQVALQQSQKEKNETARLTEVARQQVVKAEAEAKAKVLNSEAEAKAIILKAEAEAKSIDMRNKALASSHALIEYETVKTWDGKLPVQMLGGAPVPFLKLGGELSK